MSNFTCCNKFFSQLDLFKEELLYCLLVLQIWKLKSKQYKSCVINLDYIPYIRLFTRHVFSANSTLKQCFKSTRTNIFHKIIATASIYLICKRLCPIYANAFFHAMIFLGIKGKMDAHGKKLIYGNVQQLVQVLQWLHLYNAY